MKNQDYLNYYFGGVQQMMDIKDYHDLKEELQTFKEKYINFEPSEFRKKVKEEYSDFVIMNRLKFFHRSLDGINKKLQFFMVITIVGLIGVFIAVISMVK